MKDYIKVLFIGVVLMLSGYSQKDSENVDHRDIDMLVCIGVSRPSSWGNARLILVDRDTRVMYMEKVGYASGTPTVMLNSDGKPRIYEGDLD
jgi:hypothetical protein